MNVKLFGHIVFISKNIIYVGICVGILLISAVGYYIQKEKSGKAPQIINQAETNVPITETLTIQNTEPSKTVKNIKVYVVGEVVNPGIYEVPEGSIVFEIVNMAGGLSERADKNNINLAQEIRENLMMKVLTEEERKEEDLTTSLVLIKNNGENAANSQVDNSSNQGEQNLKININTATKEQLMTLPGIGEAKAGDIIAHRNQNGFFKKIEDIMSVNGIKQERFNAIKELITI